MFKINNCIITSCVLLQLHYTWNVDVPGKKSVHQSYYKSFENYS